MAATTTTALPMTEHDRELVKKALRMPWDMIGALIEKAETEEARTELETIEKAKYHREEYDAGIL